MDLVDRGRRWGKRRGSGSARPLAAREGEEMSAAMAGASGLMAPGEVLLQPRATALIAASTAAR